MLAPRHTPYAAVAAERAIIAPVCRAVSLPRYGCGDLPRLDAARCHCDYAFLAAEYAEEARDILRHLPLRARYRDAMRHPSYEPICRATPRPRYRLPLFSMPISSRRR